MRRSIKIKAAAITSMDPEFPWEFKTIYADKFAQIYSKKNGWMVLFLLILRKAYLSGI